MSFIDKAKDLVNKHEEQVDKGLDKAGEAAKGKFAGHDDQIDQVVNKAKDATGNPGE